MRFLGWVYSFERRYDEAIAECKRAIVTDPAFGDPDNDKGRMLDAIRECGRALEHCRGYGPAVAGLRRLPQRVN